jgi:hypothetical protein
LLEQYAQNRDLKNARRFYSEFPPEWFDYSTDMTQARRVQSALFALEIEEAAESLGEAGIEERAGRLRMLQKHFETARRVLSPKASALSDYENVVLDAVKPISASNAEANYEGYKLLLAINPDSSEYHSKFLSYQKALIGFSSDDMVGEWCDKIAGIDGVLTIGRVRGDQYRLRMHYEDSDRIGERELKLVGDEYRVIDSSAGDYYKVVPSGNLGLFDRHGVIRWARSTPIGTKPNRC